MADSLKSMEKEDDFRAPTHVKEELVQGRCAIQRFWGQTAIYLPIMIGVRVDDETIRKLADEVYTKPVIDKFLYSIYRDNHFVLFDVPSSLDPRTEDQENNPKYRKPDDLVEKILAAAR